METFFMPITWQGVVSLGMNFAFVFAVLWLYRPKGNKEQKNKPDNKAVDNNKEKQLGELRDLLYKHLQARVYIEKVDKDGHKYKEYNEKNDQDYIDALKTAIKELKPEKKDEPKETQGNASSI